MLASLASLFVVLPNWLLSATGRLDNNWSSKLISRETSSSKVTSEQFLTEPFKEEDDVQSTTLEFIREDETDDPVTTTTTDSSVIFPAETESIPTSTAPTVTTIDDEQHQEEQQEATTLLPLQPTSAPAVHPIDKKQQQQPVMQLFINIQPISWTQFIVQIFSSSSNDITIPFIATLLSNLIQ